MRRGGGATGGRRSGGGDGPGAPASKPWEEERRMSMGSDRVTTGLEIETEWYRKS
jgi:hypothetical protein